MTDIRTPAARSSRILGVGAHRPPRLIDNEEVCTWIDSSDEWIQQRTGIRTRRWAAQDVGVVEMSEDAAAKALAAAGLTGSDVDAVVLATVSYPYQTPAAAAVLADRLGATPAAAFDVSAGCAGFCHGIALANDLVRGGTADNVLVVGVDKLSDFTDKHDRSTAFLFADGAGAAVVGASDEVGIGPTVWGSDGSQADAIRSRFSWLDLRASRAAAADPIAAEAAAQEPEKWPYLEQQGQSVFRWAVWQMAPVAQRALDAAGVRAEDLDVFVPHQANARIIDAMVKQLKLPESVHVARDIVDMGNTSAASVPLAMERAMADGHAPSGGLALLIGYGAGLSYAAQVVRLP
ncbi:beta-ketoacyl-ACP synthase III [Kineococcus indalonis]|uniref:beta-ketoacyl-ACP synthase III n=1 Tax=Kineococcus indalonis TaxID=2696566 RepID=UPI001411D58D|nr:beta-ketoacyl-ACP synthase III [Kineococcus indalonis]NAZ86509.1 beta-ketoacyl-ACP synthase III [Kineococcus indalonis]